MRIDLILANPSFAAAVSETFIDQGGPQDRHEGHPRRPATTHH